MQILQESESKVNGSPGIQAKGLCNRRETFYRDSNEEHYSFQWSIKLRVSGLA